MLLHLFVHVHGTVRAPTFTHLAKADAMAVVAAVATVGHVVGDGATGRRATAALGQ